MGAGCIRATAAVSSERYKLTIEPPPTDGDDVTAATPATPSAEPSAAVASPPSSPCGSRSVGELKATLKDMGWKLPANVVEKSELLALVEEAEKQKAAKDAARAASPAGYKETSSQSVAGMKRRLKELGFKVPSSIVEKSELQALLEEAEHQAKAWQTGAGRPTAPPKATAAVKLGSQLRDLGVAPEQVVEEKEVRSYLSEAVQRQPKVQAMANEEGVTLTCTRGLTGVAEIQVQAQSDTSSIASENLREAEISVDPATLQRGDSIGHGSFGSVFKAMIADSGVVIAVKEVFIDVQRKPDEKLKVQLENEIEVMRSLRHPHIVSYYGCHWADDHLQMYLEYMAGGSRAQVLANFGPLEESLIARYTQQLLLGLEYLHTQNPYILHRDIKGANVLVGLDSLAKLADFGCSKRAKETTSVTIEGSIPWMAPEVLTHSRYGRAGDIWSFGCLVIEMATADSPWGHFDNLMAAILKIGMSGELPPIPDTVSVNCRGFIRRCTQHDPGKRLSATELLNEDFVLVPDEEGCHKKKEEASTAAQPAPACERIEEEDAEELLPVGWERHYDPHWSAWYYWHRNSGRSQWVRPNDDEADVEEESTSQRSGKSGKSGKSSQGPGLPQTLPGFVSDEC